MRRLLAILSLVVMIGDSNYVNSASLVACNQVVQSVNAMAAAITSETNAYWNHRETVAQLSSIPDAPLATTTALLSTAAALVAQEAAQASAIKESVPNTLEALQSDLGKAQSLGCLSSAELESAAEQATNRVRSVNFDKDPGRFPFESDSGLLTTPRMPIR